MTSAPRPAPCPFCGRNEARVEPHLGVDPLKRLVVCGNLLCHANGPAARTDREAVEAWNRSSAAPAPRPSGTADAAPVKASEARVEEEREAFEQWASGHLGYVVMLRDGYSYYERGIERSLWDAWQAARALSAPSHGEGATKHRAGLTRDAKFGSALTLDGRIVARIESTIADSRVTPDDPEPRWLKDAMVFVNAVNGSAPEATRDGGTT